MKNPVQDFLDGAGSLLTGMKVTLNNFGKEPITRHYPLDKRETPPRSRGVLRMVEFFDEQTTLNKTDFYPGSNHAPCIKGCPAHTDARGYVSYASEGKFRKGYETLKMTYPFSGTLGRVCPAPCEDICTRGVAGPEPIAIRRLKRFYDDYEQLLPAEGRFNYKDHMKPLVGKKAAVIGAGPAGLQVAWELALEGWESVVYERCPLAMGYVSLTIPLFRLEDIVWMREVRDIQESGRVEIKYNVAVGQDVPFEELTRNFDVVVVAAGATKPLKLGIPGEDGPGVEEGEPWLEAVKLGRPHRNGKNIVIVGGGSTSTDCGRTGLRLGAKSIITYRRTRAEMPASHLEVEDAIEEGVDIQFLTAPLEILRDADANITGLKCQRTKLGPRDKKGKRSPVPIPNSEFVIPADVIITSLGRGGGMDWLPKEIKRDRSGLVEVNPETNESVSTPNLYAVGDSMQVSTIIQAIAHAKTAVVGILKKADQTQRLKDLHHTGGLTPDFDNNHPKGWGKIGSDNGVAHDRKKPVTTPKEQGFSEAFERPCTDADKMFGKEWRRDTVFKNHLWKTPMQMQPCEERIKNWNECEMGFTLEEAVTEGRRCLSCDSEVCIACGICVNACPDHIIYLNAEEIPSQKDVFWADVYSIDLSRCCYCGLCTEACPTKSLVMTGDYEFSHHNKAENTIPKDWMRIGFK